MSKLGIIINGLIKENPTFVLLLGMCPTLGTTSSAINGMSMGLATMAVLICSNIVISLIKGFIPDKVHIPCYIVVIAGFVTVVQLCLKTYLPEVDAITAATISSRAFLDAVAQAYSVIAGVDAATSATQQQ